MNDPLENNLRALRWRDPPPDFLPRVLAAAQSERQRAATTRKSWLALIPRPLRIPLSACWLLALYFKLTTPEAVPAATLENYAKLPPITPAQLRAHRALTERLAQELTEQLRGATPHL